MVINAPTEKYYKCARREILPFISPLKTTSKNSRFDSIPIILMRVAFYDN